MSESPAALHAPLDVGLGGLLLASMLADWLDENPDFSAAAEAVNEPEDYRTPSEQTGLHLPTPVNARASTPPSGEHRASVCPTGEGIGTGVERSGDPHSRPRSRDVGSTSNAAGRLQDPGSGRLDGAGGRGVCLGDLTSGALEFRLASIAGVVRADINVGDRPR